MEINKNKFDSDWKRVIDKAVNEGLEIDGKILKLEESFKFHDLKAKGVSDHTVRKLKEVDATR